MVNFFASTRNPKDNCPYAAPRKQYTRTKPIPHGWHKIKPLKNEKAAIIKLTNLGYSINQIADPLGRSTSYIHRILRTQIVRGWMRKVDKRKLVSQIRLRTSAIRVNLLSKLWQGWLDFMYGFKIDKHGERVVVDKPP